MDFGTAVSTGFKKYATFDGRASVSEYWWWVLFCFLGSLATSLVSHKLSGLFSLLVLVPHIAVAVRRLHDINRSGWWLLIWLIPIIGWIILLIWFIGGPVEPNQFGDENTQEM